MSRLIVSTPNNETYTSISNLFIDYYMPKANGEFVKIYLYLLRMMNMAVEFTVSDVADNFESTEKDIWRAITYWTKTGVMTADKKENGDIKLILLPLNESSEEITQYYPSNEKEPINSENLVTKKKPKTGAGREIKPVSDFNNILYQTEMYFGQPLTQSDVRSLLYINNNLSFSYELMEYLIEHCVSMGKKNMRYIESVALDWSRKGIKTVNDAKDAITNFNEKYMAVFKQLGITGRLPVAGETEIIDAWYDVYLFDTEMIIEACKRAVEAKPQAVSLKYVDGILSKWHEKNIHTISELNEADKNRSFEKKQNSSQKNQFNQYHNSTDNGVIDEFEKLFLNETNK